MTFKESEKIFPKRMKMLHEKYPDEVVERYTLEELVAELKKHKNPYLQRELAKRADMLEYWENADLDGLYCKPLLTVAEKLGVAGKI